MRYLSRHQIAKNEAFMRIHDDFTLYWRAFPSGVRVVYYYAYDEKGNRHGGYSTGQSNKTAARKVCNQLLKTGKLIPNSGFMPTFAEYSEGWWDKKTCKYLKKRMKRHNLTDSYIDHNRGYMINQFVPYFGKMKLDKITPDEIENWLDYLSEDYKHTYINTLFGLLQTMMIEAAARKIITASPTMEVEKLVNDRKPIKIITPEEFRKMFVEDWKRVWDNDRICYTANKLAALTGMRSSEVLGLRGEYVYEDHIYKCKQYDEYGYRDTKTKDKHNIPLTPDMIGDLKDLTVMNGSGFLFSLDGGETPICRHTMYDNFHRACNRIGISKEEIHERGLCLHAWRHFCNTELQKAGISISKVQSVTGHKSDRMTEWYCHFDPNEFGEVRKAQEALLRPSGGNEGPPAGSTQKGGKEIPETEQHKKRANIIPLREGIPA
jgi:integrase